jgi:large subunit ribosomal protein L14e
MGEALIEGSNWRLVEVGRVVLINGDHPFSGRLAAIVEIIDHKRVCLNRRNALFKIGANIDNDIPQVLVEGPSTDSELVVPRQSVPLSKCLLSQLTVEGLNRGARHASLKKQWESSEIDNKWKESNWAKKRDQIARRKALTDFERFQVLRLKKQRRFEERKALAKVKASA